MLMSKELRPRGRMSKIEQHGLVEHAINLLTVQPRLTYKQIAEELNAIAGIENEEDKITEDNVANFAKTYPEVRKEVMLANRKYLRRVVFESAEFDMLGTLRDLAARLSVMIDEYEEDSLNRGKTPDPLKYKALTSELRETLKLIMEIHKEIYDMEIVRQFLIEVVKTLKEVSPEALDEFVRKMKGKRDNSLIVNEILKGGIR